MADLPQGSSTFQTGTNDTATVLVNNVSPMNANQMNGAYSAIIQIETILGSGPDLIGSSANLAARLAVQMSAAGVLLPIGSMIMHGGVLPPLFIDAFGQEISRSGIYANLFAVYGTTFGAGNGTTTFNVINMSGRVPKGLGTGIGGGSAGTGAPTGGSTLSNILMGAWRGEEAHILTQAELPSYNLPISDPGHNHVEQTYDGGSGTVGRRFNTTQDDLNTGNVVDDSHGTGDRVTGITVPSGGSGNAHNTISPELGVRFIIKY